ncbi:MAG: transposase [bacterium]
MIQFRKYNPEYHHRRSIRLKGYDYSREGMYFITICSHGRDHLFGKIENGKMILNPMGQIARHEWIKTTEIRTNITLGEYVVMPNHIHGIVVINGLPGIVGAYGNTPLRSPTKTVGAIVRGYKSAVTKQINILRNCPKCPVWQRNYYEHIIYDESEYLRISEYIYNNPANWMDDTLNL